MLILTQDKSTVVNLDNITQIYCIRYDESNVDIACCFNRGGEILGRYSSIKRCKEILKEIVEAYNAIEISKLYANSGTYSDYHYESFEYYMPEE